MNFLARILDACSSTSLIRTSVFVFFMSCLLPVDD
jgi:hypothetical protein